MNRRTLISAVVLLSIVAGLALAGPVAAQETGTANETGNETASVVYEDQEINSSVTVAEATLPEGGFVAVYNESGGYVGSSGYLDAGTHENVTVELEREFTRAQVSYAQAYTDDGDESFAVGNESAYRTGTNATVSDSAYLTSGDSARTATNASTGTTTDGSGETSMSTDDSNAGGDGETDGTETSIPGFTAVLALVAVLGAALLARR